MAALQSLLDQHTHVQEVEFGRSRCGMGYYAKTVRYLERGKGGIAHGTTADEALENLRTLLAEKQA